MKKTFKRLGAVLLAMAMAVSVLCTGALADEDGGSTTTPTYSITISNTTSGYTYEAYQVFAGTLGTKAEGNTETPLGITDWGKNLKNKESALITALQADSTIGTDFTNVLKKGNTAGGATIEATSVEAAQNVAAAIKNYGNDSEKAKAFAKIVAENVTGNAVASANTVTDSKGYVIGLESAGYYIVKNTVAPSENTDENAAYSNYILKVVGNESVTPKSSVPEVTKKIVEGNEEKDATTVNYGDTVTFKLTATLPDNYKDYEKNGYALTFHDTLSSTLDFDKDKAKITVQYQKYKQDDTDSTKWVVDGDAVTVDSSGYKVSVSGDEGHDSHTVDIAISNVYDLTSNNTKIATDAHGEIIVTYKATVKNTAEVGNKDTNFNKVYLQYSNDPNDKNHTGNTPEDKVNVYTFQLNVNKVIKGSTTPLSGAKFKLYKMVGESKSYATVDENKKLTGWDTTGTELTTDAQGNISVIGLKEGIYYLEETEAPAGYNKLTGPVKIEITATMDEGTKANVLKELAATVDGTTTTTDLTAGIVTAKVENSAGSTLPSTGGMGTTLFYVIGGVLMAGAAIVLVIKKKRSSAE